MDNTDSRIESEMRQIVAWLVNKDFAAVHARSGGNRLSTDQLRQAVEEYGRTLVIPPDEAFRNLDVVRVMHRARPTWSVRFDLWTKEEGRSDLSIECTLIDLGTGNLNIELDNLHVL